VLDSSFDSIKSAIACAFNNHINVHAMKNILVPTDFSEYAQYALEFAKDIAKRENAKLSILHSVYTPHFFDSLYMDPILASKLMKDLETGAQEKLADTRNVLAEQGVEAETITTCSPLITAIDDCLLYTSPSPRD